MATGESVKGTLPVGQFKAEMSPKAVHLAGGVQILAKSLFTGGKWDETVGKSLKMAATREMQIGVTSDTLAAAHVVNASDVAASIGEIRMLCPKLVALRLSLAETAAMLSACLPPAPAAAAPSPDRAAR